MNYPRITVVTPSYNKAKYLQETIKSVLNQNYPNLEYFIMDPGSTDGSREIIKKYAARHKEIKFFFKSDKGQWDAVNNGFKQATGDLLGFLNADDLYTDRSLFKLAEFRNKNPHRLWFAGQSLVVDVFGNPIFKAVNTYKNFLLALNKRNLLYIVNYLMQPSVFISKEAFCRYGDFIGEKKYILEYDYWLRLCKSEMPIVISSNLSKFRITQNMASMNINNQLLSADDKIVSTYIDNKVILFLHKLHNFGRIVISKSHT